MTSLVVWVSADHRGPASIYIATDSRISWPAGPRGSTHWDGARKTYSATKTPHVLGYVGDVIFPALALPTVVAQLDESPQAHSVESAQKQVLDLVDLAWRDVPAEARLGSWLVHGVRIGDGTGCKFGAQILHLPPGATKWTSTPLEVPNFSSKIEFLGSGRGQLEKDYRNWVRSRDEDSRDRTSRAVFSAFCDALDSEYDPPTGGAPQLVGLYRIGFGRSFGVHWKGEPFVHGTHVADFAYADLEYRNSRFERTNRSGLLITGAQRHARKPT
ncbi:hypothetical protein SAMN04488564_103427 [Lentzea waywayandensis]|uniref:Uncharacterized protein n=1 Tax=Lentzea waywayandensis TaxID=84724 RepID=A0A1I6DYS8_9PSEU|nr:hypothetical protein SAMN04488564_103427 [Lentzea waywayandensis]